MAWGWGIGSVEVWIIGDWDIVRVDGYEFFMQRPY
jgi:hypothetical protein